MEYLVEFEGTPGIYIRATAEDYGLEPVGTVENAVRKVTSTLADALGSVKQVADAVAEKVGELAKPPSEFTAEFGLELGASGKFIVANSDVKSTLKICVTWNSKKDA